MALFRVWLVVVFVAILVYTLGVGARHGYDLMPVFFGDIARMAWPGQFNVDFLSFLILSALWLAWRHDFSPLGLALAPLGLFGGGLFLSAYLLLLTWRTRGDVAVMLLGPRRAAVLRGNR